MFRYCRPATCRHWALHLDGVHVRKIPFLSTSKYSSSRGFRIVQHLYSDMMNRNRLLTSHCFTSGHFDQISVDVNIMNSIAEVCLCPTLWFVSCSMNESCMTAGVFIVHEKFLLYCHHPLLITILQWLLYSISFHERHAKAWYRIFLCLDSQFTTCLLCSIHGNACVLSF